MAKRGRPRKNPLPEKADDTVAAAASAATTVAVEETPAPKKKSAVETLSEAISAAIKENPQAVTDMLGSVLNVATGQVRTVEPPESRVVESPKAEKYEMGETIPPEGVLFKSSAMGFRQVLTRSKKVHFGDDYETIPPKIVDFAPNGSARLDEPDEIAAMRRKIQWRKNKGLPPVVAEVPAVLAKDMKDVETVKSSTGVTADTPVTDVLSA